MCVDKTKMKRLSLFFLAFLFSFPGALAADPYGDPAKQIKQWAEKEIKTFSGALTAAEVEDCYVRQGWFLDFWRRRQIDYDQFFRSTGFTVVGESVQQQNTCLRNDVTQLEALYHRFGDRLAHSPLACVEGAEYDRAKAFTEQYLLLIDGLWDYGPMKEEGFEIFKKEWEAAGYNLSDLPIKTFYTKAYFDEKSCPSPSGLSFQKTIASFQQLMERIDRIAEGFSELTADAKKIVDGDFALESFAADFLRENAPNPNEARAKAQMDAWIDRNLVAPLEYMFDSGWSCDTALVRKTEDGMTFCTNYDVVAVKQRQMDREAQEQEADKAKAEEGGNKEDTPSIRSDRYSDAEQRQNLNNDADAFAKYSREILLLDQGAYRSLSVSLSGNDGKVLELTQEIQKATEHLETKILRSLESFCSRHYSCDQ